MVHFPVILPKESILEVSSVIVAQRIGDRISIHERRHQLGNLVAGIVGAIARDVEESLGAIVALEKVHFAEDDVGAELEAVLAMDPAGGVQPLECVLRHFVRSAIPGVADLGIVAADQRAAAEQGIAIRVQDSQIGREWLALERIDVAEERPLVAEAEIVHRVCAEDMRPAAGHAARMGVVVSGTEPGRQAKIPRILGVVVHLIAVAGEEHILRTRVVIHTRVEVVVPLGVELLAAIIVQNVRAGVIGCGKDVEILDRGCIESSSRNHVRSANDRAARAQTKLRARGWIEDRPIIETGVQLRSRRVHSMETAEGGAACGTVGSSAADRRNDGQAFAQQIGEVPGAHLCRRYRRYVEVQRQCLTQALIIREEEQLVLQNGAAEGAPELVAVRVSRCTSEVVRIRAPHAVSIEGECGTVNLVRTRLGRHFHDRAAGAPELGGSQTDNGSELRRGLDGGPHIDAVGQRFVVIHTVHQVVIRLRTNTVRRQRNAARIAVAQLLGVAARPLKDSAVRAASDARSQKRKLAEISAVQRQIDKIAIVDHRRERRIRGFHQRSCARHGNRRAGRASFQLKIELLHLRDVQGEILYLRFKPLRNDLGAVLPSLERVKGEVAGGVARRGISCRGSQVGHCYLRSGDHCSGGVSHRALNLGGVGLRMDARRHEYRKYQQHAKCQPPAEEIPATLRCKDHCVASKNVPIRSRFGSVFSKLSRASVTRLACLNHSQCTASLFSIKSRSTAKSRHLKRMRLYFTRYRTTGVH